METDTGRMLQLFAEDGDGGRLYLSRPTGETTARGTPITTSTLWTVDARGRRRSMVRAVDRLHLEGVDDEDARGLAYESARFLEGFGFRVYWRRQRVITPGEV